MLYLIYNIWKEVHRTNGHTVKIYSKGGFFLKHKNESKVIVF